MYLLFYRILYFCFFVIFVPNLLLLKVYEERIDCLTTMTCAYFLPFFNAQQHCAGDTSA